MGWSLHEDPWKVDFPGACKQNSPWGMFKSSMADFPQPSLYWHGLYLEYTAVECSAITSHLSLVGTCISMELLVWILCCSLHSLNKIECTPPGLQPAFMGQTWPCCHLSCLRVCAFSEVELHWAHCKGSRTTFCQTNGAGYMDLWSLCVMFPCWESLVCETFHWPDSQISLSTTQSKVVHHPCCPCDSALILFSKPLAPPAPSSLSNWPGSWCFKHQSPALLVYTWPTIITNNLVYI